MWKISRNKVIPVHDQGIRINAAIFTQGFSFGSGGSSWTISHDATTRWLSMQMSEANFDVKKRRKHYGQGATIFKS